MSETDGRAEQRLVDLSWDRTHDELTAVVRAESDAGIVVSPVHDHAVVPGRLWIRRDEVVDLDDLEADDPDVLLAHRRGWLTTDGEPEPTGLPALLDGLVHAHRLIGVHLSRTGSDEMLAGYARSVDHDRLVVDEVTPTACRSGDTIDFRLDEIIAVRWDDPYLAGLDELAASG